MRKHKKVSHDACIVAAVIGALIALSLGFVAGRQTAPGPQGCVQRLQQFSAPQVVTDYVCYGRSLPQ